MLCDDRHASDACPNSSLAFQGNALYLELKDVFFQSLKISFVLLVETARSNPAAGQTGYQGPHLGPCCCQLPRRCNPRVHRC